MTGLVLLFRTGSTNKYTYTSDVSFNRMFYALFGYCWQISNYKLLSDLRFIEKEGNLTFNIFLTDSLMITKPGLDLSQYIGKDIVLDSRSYESYFIELEKYSNYNPKKPDECKEYAENEYQNCVNTAINQMLTNEFADSLICNPAWLGIENACQDMNWKNPNLTVTKSKELDKKLMNIMKMELEELKFICKPPCVVTRANIRTGRSKDYLGVGRNTPRGFGITLIFDETVKYSKAIIGYGFSNFLIDFGSSVGLWFGISAIGKLLFNPIHGGKGGLPLIVIV